MGVKNEPGGRIKEGPTVPNQRGVGGAVPMTGGQTNVAESGLKGGEGVKPRANGPDVGGNFRGPKSVGVDNTQF